jgi:hypothetical protein
VNPTQPFINNTSQFMKRFLVFAVFSLILPYKVFPQDIPFETGEVTVEDLTTGPLPWETVAAATVLSDYATAKMIYNNGVKIAFTRHVRMKLFSSSGYGFANIQLPYTRYDKLLNLKAFTYNIEDNRIAKIAVEKRQLYVEKVDPYHNMIRFTFPNIREGSVIEYSYTIIMDEIWAYRGVRFQHTIPVRHVEYQASVPDFFKYTIYYSQNNFIQFQQDIENGYFNGFPTNISIYHWMGNNIPAFSPEPFMPEGEEYMAGVDFTLTSVNYPGGDPYLTSSTYEKLTEELLDFSMTGHQIDNTLIFAGKVFKITEKKDSPLKNMQAIYNYVQNHMKWNGYEQMWTDKSLIKAFREGTGTNAEINLMLVNMLRTAGIKADPVVLSLRNNGRIKTQVAMIGNLNYLICCADINGIYYLLDATDKFRPAGMLPFKCLNDKGFVLSKTHGRWINLLNNEKYAIREYYDLTLNDNEELTGHGTVVFSGYNALDLRRLLHNEGEAGFMEEKLSHMGNVTISNLQFEDLDSIGLPLRITFDVILKHTVKNANQILFFKPLISIFGDYTNPWIKDERIFPVDKGCPGAQFLNCSIRLPERYQPEFLPETVRIRLPDDGASFLFGLEYSGLTLNIACELNLRKTYFEVGEYPNIREFYAQVNKKCNEMIIIKKDW